MFDLARVLAERGHSVRVLCSRRSYDGESVHPRHETTDGVRIDRLPAFGFGRRFAAGRLLDYASFLALLFLRVLLQRPKPDLVLALTTPPYVGLVAKLACCLRRMAHAHWVMDLYPDVMVAHGMFAAGSFCSRFLSALTRWQLRGAAAVLAIGPDMAERLASRCGGQTPPCVPLWGEGNASPWPAGQPNPLREERGWSREDLVLMYSGNMGLGHRLGEFLAAARSLPPNCGVVWAFAGGGKRRREVEEALSAEPGLPVALLPYVAAEQLSEHLGSADVLLASLELGWQGTMVPSKLQGAFAARRPVIFVGAVESSLGRWIAESGGGWVVPPGDLEALNNAVKAAGDAAERRRRGDLAREYAVVRFDLRRNCAHIAQILERAVLPNTCSRGAGRAAKASRQDSEPGPGGHNA